MISVALIDYGSGNLHSAEKALARAASAGRAETRITVTADPAQIAASDRVVLPGVGAFGACMAALSARPGLVEALTTHALERQRPFLGICVGMQLLAAHGEEHGRHKGLGWIAGRVRPLVVGDLKIPHMGWNTVRGQGHDLLPPDGDAYFVHSYCFDADNPSDVAAHCEYAEPFPAMVALGNIVGVQFHPEKSQAYGLALLANFLTWEPA